MVLFARVEVYFDHLPPQPVNSMKSKVTAVLFTTVSPVPGPRLGPQQMPNELVSALGGHYRWVHVAHKETDLGRSHNLPNLS